jgi:GntR family transcriptional regulator / MocR family aminotransferase
VKVAFAQEPLLAILARPIPDRSKTITFIQLDNKDSGTPLYRQIYESIRHAILRGEFAAQTRLPATRLLAEQLGVARTTVVNAYEQLLAEGYIEGRPGSGTYVAKMLPDEMLRVKEEKLSRSKGAATTRKPFLSQRGKWIASTCIAMLRVQADGNQHAFQNGMPAVDEFPFKLWSQLAARRWRNPPRELLGYGDPAGYLPLRASIAAHLKAARGVQCDVDQIIIVAGAQQALDLTARVLLGPDEIAWFEDPCYPGARNSFLFAGATVRHIPVDREGFDLASAIKHFKTARLVYVTPSHQFPLGITMSLSRRLALLEWAERSNAFIIEDDYNSEYRYAGRPLASLQGLDRDDRVIYIGTFSKTIFPSLRLGCIVVPKVLTNAFIAARALIDRHSPSLDQATLADFINEGHFARHIRRMRSLYQERQNLLVAAAKRELEGLMEVAPAEAGMHLVGWLPKNVNDKAASEKAARYGVEAAPVSAYSANVLPRGGLALGYAGVNSRQIKDGVRRLARALS